MKCKKGHPSVMEDCDENGDFRDGWQNCSVCGETDWESLFTKRFNVTEVLDLITQSQKVMDILGEIEAEHFERTYSEMNSTQISANTPFDFQEVEMELASDEPFAGYLGDLELLVKNLVTRLSLTERMELFITAHDEIFDTTWRPRYFAWVLENATKKYRQLRMTLFLRGGLNE